MAQKVSQTRIALLSLFALALHLLLAFGHHHEGVAANRAAAVAICLAQADCDTGHEHAPGHHEDACEICALIAMARAISIPAVLELKTPAVAQRIEFETPSVSYAMYRPHLAFQARGPPPLSKTA